MKLSIEKKLTEEIDVIFPSFFRNREQTHYVGLLNEETGVRIYIQKDHISITNTRPDFMAHTIEEAYRSFHSCTETDFFEAYEKAIHAITLHPKLSI
jgi:hypothetical protein